MITLRSYFLVLGLVASCGDYTASRGDAVNGTTGAPDTHASANAPGSVGANGMSTAGGPLPSTTSSDHSPLGPAPQRDGSETMRECGGCTPGPGPCSCFAPSETGAPFPVADPPVPALSSETDASVWQVDAGLDERDASASQADGSTDALDASTASPNELLDGALVDGGSSADGGSLSEE